MLWIDHQCYFGPDRRSARGGLRLRERRREDYAGKPPPLATALRQLRMRVIEAEGEAGIAAFAARAKQTAALAAAQQQNRAAQMLTAIANQLPGKRGDVRQALYRALDQIQATIPI